MKKGESVWKRSDDIVVCNWKNKRNVLTISNKHSVEMVPVPNKRGQLITKPSIKRDYNNGMSGVDRSNQMLSYYQGLRKCIQWYKKVKVHFLDIFLHNSLYLTKQQCPGRFKIPLLEYRTIALKSLIGHYNPIALELRKYGNRFPKLIRASEKKRNPTLKCRVCYQNQIRRDTR